MTTTMMNLLVSAWTVVVPVALGIGLKKEEGRISFAQRLKFRDQNIQIPFFNNVLAGSLAIDGNQIVVSSGLFQTAWKCAIPTESIVTNFIVNPADGSGACQRLISGPVGVYYEGTNRPDTVSDLVQNDIGGSFASWAFNATKKFGFGWGRSISIKGDHVAVGCPGCTGASHVVSQALQSGTAEGAREMSGLVFEWKNTNEYQAYDNSKAVDPIYKNDGSRRLEGDFDPSLFGDSEGPVFNRDSSCRDLKSACNFGMAVTYWGETLFGSRSRVPRLLRRQDGIIFDTGTNQEVGCQTGFGTLYQKYCGFDDAVHLAVGDVIDVEQIDNSFPEESLVDGQYYELDKENGRRYGIAGLGYKSNDDLKFKRLRIQNDYSPAYARVGEALTTGTFYDATSPSLVVGAPGYGLTGAVLIYKNTETRSVSDTGLRNKYGEPTTVLQYPGGSSDFVKYNFGAAVHSFKMATDSLDEKDTHLAVGAPTYQEENVGGAVFLYEKIDGDDFTLRAILKPKDRSIFNLNQRFGWSIASIDLDGDNVNDVVVGAPFNQLNCPIQSRGSYCGAIYVFDGQALNQGSGVVEVVETSVTYGPEISSMLGYALVANDNNVFASAPGGFGNDAGQFNDILYNGINRKNGPRNWVVDPKVLFYGKLSPVKVTTSGNGVTSDTVVLRAANVYTLDTEGFNENDEEFTVAFNLKTTATESKFAFVTPAVFADTSLFNVTTQPAACLIAAITTSDYSTSGYCTYSNSITATITVKRLQLAPATDDELARLNNDIEFKVVQLINTETQTLSRDSTTEASIFVNVDTTVDSDIQLNANVNGTQFKVGQEITTEIIVINNRETSDASLSLRIEIDQIRPVDLEYDADTWSSAQFMENSDEFPTTFVTKRLPRVDGQSSETYPFDFKIKEVQSSNVQIRYILFGTEASDTVVTNIVVDNSCNPTWSSTAVVDSQLETSVVPDQIFEYRVLFQKTVGNPYYAQTTTYLNDSFTIVDLDTRCTPTILRTEIACPDEANVIVQDGYILSPDETEIGCIVKEFLSLECKDNSSPVGGIAPLPAPFVNRLKVAPYIEVPADEVELILGIATYFTGDATCNTVPGQVQNLVVESQSQSPPPPPVEEVEWWIYVAAAVGALLIGLIIALILWKLGFFKRNKPPKDDEMDSGALDTEQNPGVISAGSVLRG